MIVTHFETEFLVLWIVLNFLMPRPNTSRIFFFFFYASLIYVTIVDYVDELPFSQSLEKIFRFSKINYHAILEQSIFLIFAFP